MSKKHTAKRHTTSATVSSGTRKAEAISTTTEKAWLDDAAFTGWIRKLQISITLLSKFDTPLFLSRPVDLFSIYLRNIPKASRQYHNCNTCRTFLNKYGRLLFVNEDGTLVPLWAEDDAPAFYHPAVKAMREAVIDAGIASPFICRDSEWGERHTRKGSTVWEHFAIVPPANYVAPFNPIKDEHQLMAEKVEDYKNVDRALREFSVKTLDLALALLNSDALYRSEKVLAPAEWLQGLARERLVNRGRNFANKLWVEIAKAPAGFCHPRASMIGSLLEDLQDDKTVEEARRAFAAKMHPLAYQRPQAAPSEQTIDRAEEIVAKLGIGSALMRRIANPGDIPASAKLWVPGPTAPPERPGYFDAIRPKFEDAKAVGGITRMTWAKFERDVMPFASKIEAKVPTVGYFTVLCTAVDPLAPPLMRWDNETHRNPFNWYVWTGGSMASQHGLTAGWHEVCTVTDRPCMWNQDRDRSGFPPSRLFFLTGATERRTSGSALFPECIRSELHEIRSVIERYSKKYDFPISQNAAVALPIANNLELELCVTHHGIVQTITLDRME